MDKTPRQKISKETEDMNNTTDQMDLTDIYRTFHPRAAKYKFFSSAQKAFSRIDHKTTFNKFKKIEIIPSILSHHNGMKLEVKNSKEI